jgi:uncharacterized protein
MNEPASKRVEEGVIQIIREVVMMVRHLVNNPDDVVVDVEQKGYTILVALKTNPEDVGQVIGRNAHLIASIRSLLAAISGKNGVRAILDFVTEEDNKRASKRTVSHRKYGS